jgi:2-polyprenyl-6-methoxyphenol hydroxylase-like FAD-dependent oxidoreductase
MDVILAGDGIGGLAAALWLHQVGIRCRVHEAAQEYNRVGIYINLQPHAVKVRSELGLQAALLQRGVVRRHGEEQRADQSIPARVCNDRAAAAQRLTTASTATAKR